VLITGDAGGIGAATALAAADAGGNVVIIGRRIAQGENVAEQACTRGVKAQFAQGDVNDEASIERAVKQLVRLGGRLDMAFNNAGVELMGINTADSSAAIGCAPPRGTRPSAPDPVTTRRSGHARHGSNSSPPLSPATSRSMSAPPMPRPKR
jgi:NAD(P)-dependent dehydrogenase (short-subunit alcohol dehydrogenase family)